MSLVGIQKGYIILNLPLFDGIDEGNFGNNSVRNLAIFSVYSSSSSHTNNPKNNFLVLSEGDTFGTNESLKSLVLILVKKRPSFAWFRTTIVIKVNRKKIYEFKENNKNVNFPSQFCLRSVFKKSDMVEEVSVKGNVYDFSVDYDANDKSDILHIHMYLMVNNSIKLCSGLLNKCLMHYLVLVAL